MARQYEYKARDAGGQLYTGLILADDEAGVAGHIRTKGLYVTQIKLAKSTQDIGVLLQNRRKISTRDLSILCRQFATMLEAGMPILNCLGVLAEQTENPPFVLSAFFAGLAGSLLAHYLSFVSPDMLSSAESIMMLTMVVVGGARSIHGCFLGAFLLTILPEALRMIKDTIGLPFDPWLVLFGLILILMMRVRPQGILGADTVFRR